MQHIVETIVFPDSFVFAQKEAVGFLTQERIEELLETALDIQTYLIDNLGMGTSDIILEWSYCVDGSNGMERKEKNYKLCYWGLRSG